MRCASSRWHRATTVRAGRIWLWTAERAFAYARSGGRLGFEEMFGEVFRFGPGGVEARFHSVQDALRFIAVALGDDGQGRPHLAMDGREGFRLRALLRKARLRG